MADDQTETTPPEVITPLESAYIRAAITAILPAINWVIYSTNLDEVLHITSLTTNQVWQGLNAVLIVLSVVLTIRKRIKEGKNPDSTAPKIVLRKPDPPEQPKDEFKNIADTIVPQVAPKDAMAQVEELAEKIRKLHPGAGKS